MSTINPQHKIAIIILAAGASKRMGQPKQLLTWGDTTLLGDTIKKAKHLSSSILVVLGANATKIRSTLNKEVQVTICPNREQGMGVSLAHGIKVITENVQYDSVLVLLVDQPLFTIEYLSNLLKTHQTYQPKITATSYGSKNGVPAIFHHSIFSELLELNADYGARRLIEKHRVSVKSIEPKGMALDIDTYEKYIQIKSKYDLY